MLRARLFAILSFLTALLSLTLALAPSLANAQGLIVPQRSSKIVCTQGTVGTTATSAGVSTAQPSLIGWSICHQAGDLNAWLAVGSAADPATAGIRLGVGQCYVCNSCSPGTLTTLKVNSSAAGTTYGVCQQSGG